jgi:tetratricopeptide (TPR) repeat protein
MPRVDRDPQADQQLPHPASRPGLRLSRRAVRAPCALRARRGRGDRGPHLGRLDAPPAPRHARELDLATGDIAARRYDIAETRLARLLRRAPDFAEAWHKRAALYYLLGRDAECLSDIRRTLELEPRHFGAMLHFAEIVRCARGPAEAGFAVLAARSIHPHLTIPD